MNRTLDEQTVKLTLPSKFGYERIAMASSAAFAKILGFKQDRIEDLKTAVSEAYLNAIEHGNKWHPDVMVVVTSYFKDEELIVSVMDKGDGITKIADFGDIEDKVEKLESPRGLGIFLISRLVDHVDFNVMTDEGHGVRMVFRKK